MVSNFLNRFALGSTIVMLGLWGIVLIVAPEIVHSYFSSEPMNAAQASMMGAGFLGLAFISFAIEINWLTPVRALGVAIAIIAGVAIYHMFFASIILITPLTTMSLVAAIAVAFFMIV